MKKCPYCDSLYDDALISCPYCGKRPKSEPRPAVAPPPVQTVPDAPTERRGGKKGGNSGVARGLILGLPLGALLTIWFSSLVTPILPYMLSFAAGAMVYVVVEELIPETSAGSHSNLGTVAFAVGFTVMMALDCALG